MTPEEAIHILLTIKTASIYEEEAIRMGVEAIRMRNESLKKEENTNSGMAIEEVKIGNY